MSYESGGEINYCCKETQPQKALFETRRVVISSNGMNGMYRKFLNSFDVYLGLCSLNNILFAMERLRLVSVITVRFFNFACINSKF